MKRLMWYLAAAACVGYGLERLAEWTANWAPAMPAADITYEGSGEIPEGAFDQITSGTNTSATMVIGTGATSPACLSSSNGTLIGSGAVCEAATPTSCAPGEYAGGVNASGFAQCYRPAPPGSRQ